MFFCFFVAHKRKPGIKKGALSHRFLLLGLENYFFFPFLILILICDHIKAVLCIFHFVICH